MKRFNCYDPLSNLKGRHNLLLLLTLLQFTTASGQRSRTFTVPIEQLYAGEAIRTYDLRDKGTKGSVYWFDEWNQGAILLKNGQKVDQYEVKYDIQSWMLEINTPKGVKILPGAKVKEFYLEKAVGKENTERYHLINLREYFEQNIPSQGFYELLVDGSYPLVKNFELDMLKPNYVPALDAGETQSKIIKKTRYYLIKNKILIELPSSRKKFTDIIKKIKPEVADFMKENKLKPKNEEEMIEIITFCNE